MAKEVNSQTKGSGFNPEPTVGILELDALKPNLLLNEINLNSLEVDVAQSQQTAILSQRLNQEASSVLTEHQPMFWVVFIRGSCAR